MNPFCGEKEVFLEDEDIKRCGCITNGSKMRCRMKTGFRHIKSNSPCRYFIMRKKETSNEKNMPQV